MDGAPPFANIVDVVAVDPDKRRTTIRQMLRRRLGQERVTSK